MEVVSNDALSGCQSFDHKDDIVIQFDDTRSNLCTNSEVSENTLSMNATVPPIQVSEALKKPNEDVPLDKKHDQKTWNLAADIVCETASGPTCHGGGATVESQVSECVAESESVSQLHSNAVAIIRKADKPNIKKGLQSFNIFTKMSESSESDRNMFLWHIIMKLKEKGDELKSNSLLTYYPSANSRINALTLHLVDKQKENEKLKKKQKDLENHLNELKKVSIRERSEKKEVSDDRNGVSKKKREEELSMYIKEIDELRKEKEANKIKIDQLSVNVMKYGEINAECDENKMMIEQLSTDLANKVDQIAELKAENEGNKNISKQLSIDLANKVDQIAKLKRENEKSKNSIEQLSTDLGNHVDQIAGYKQINEDLREKLNAKGCEIERYRKAENELQEKLKVLEANAGTEKVENKNGQVTSNKCEDDQAEKQITELK